MKTQNEEYVTIKVSELKNLYRKIYEYQQMMEQYERIIKAYELEEKLRNQQ